MNATLAGTHHVNKLISYAKLCLLELTMPIDVAFQGRLGDCWLMAGIAVLCENKKLFRKVVDPNQGFTKETNYCGKFR